MNEYPHVQVMFNEPSAELSTSSLESDPAYIDVVNPDFWLYRARTIALLKRYLRISIEVGRLPSILGRELFRSKVTSYRMSSFEDAVIFVHDVEQALDQLQLFPRQIIAAVLFQEYTQEQAAEVLHCGRRTIAREFPIAPDIAALRDRITGLVAQNAVAMVQCAIDAVREEGQYQAIKYLFEMVGLYPAVAGSEDVKQDSLAEILLKQIELRNEGTPVSGSDR